MSRYRDVRLCPDCNQMFDVDFEEKTGRCVQCAALLCADCIKEAMGDRQGLCSNCGVPMLPDDDLDESRAPGKVWGPAYLDAPAVNDARARKKAWAQVQQGKRDLKKGQR